MSISLRGGARRLQRLPSLKYYYLLKWGSKFTLEINAAKNTHCIKKCFKLKLLNIKFCSKTEYIDNRMNIANTSNIDNALYM